MIVLADTSVWVDHWRQGNETFAALLRRDAVVVHPFIIGELALGALTPRSAVLGELSRLRSARPATHPEVMGLIEQRRLWGRGLGWLDAHLLASALLDNVRLWSLDRAVVEAARTLRIAFTAS